MLSVSARLTSQAEYEFRALKQDKSFSLEVAILCDSVHRPRLTLSRWLDQKFSGTTGTGSKQAVLNKRAERGRERQVVVSSRAAGSYSCSDELSARAPPPLLKREDGMTPVKEAGTGARA